MSAPPPAQHQPFLVGDKTYTPSAPIPIPFHRRVTSPPPRSPSRKMLSPDLLFDMSPIPVNSPPLSRLARDIYNNGDSFLQGSALFASRVNLVSRPRSPSIDSNLHPYYYEPFMYPIPGIPARMPPSQDRTDFTPSAPRHSRSKSDSRLVNNTTGGRLDDTIFPSDLISFSTSFAASYSSSLSSGTLPVSVGSKCDDPESVELASHIKQHPLTAAFQRSIASTSISSTTEQFVSSPHSSIISQYPAVPLPISPPASIQTFRGTSGRTIFGRKNATKTNYARASMRTSIAAPVVSFAQVELDHPNSTHCTRSAVIKTKSPPKIMLPKVRSPYPRGRHDKRMTVTMTGRGGSPMMLSDEDIVRSLQPSGETKNSDLAKYLSKALTLETENHQAKKKDEGEERGRTRNRIRLGWRGHA